MNFVKLHKGGVEVLVNMSTVSEVYHAGDNENMSKLYFNFSDGDGMQVSIIADESLEEIYEMLKEFSK